MNYAIDIASALQKEIEHLPDGFYDSFDYTVTGQNFTHPLTLGLLTKILWQIEGVNFVAVDFRLNNFRFNKGRVKFQTDLVALSRINHDFFSKHRW